MRASVGILVVAVAVILGRAPGRAHVRGDDGIVQADKSGSTRKVTKTQVEEEAAGASSKDASPSSKGETEQPSPATPRTPALQPSANPKGDRPAINRRQTSPVTTKKITKKTGGRPASTATLAR